MATISHCVLRKEGRLASTRSVGDEEVGDSRWCRYTAEYNSL